MFSFASSPILKALLFPATLVFHWPFSLHLEKLDIENTK